MFVHKLACFACFQMRFLQAENVRMSPLIDGGFSLHSIALDLTGGAYSALLDPLARYRRNDRGLVFTGSC